MARGVCNTGESSGSYLECGGNHWRAGQRGDAPGPAFYEASGAVGEKDCGRGGREHGGPGWKPWG